MNVMQLSARLEEIGDLAALETRWRALETVAGETVSFFLRWTWMGSWLSALSGAKIALPQLLTIVEGERDVALALVGRIAARRKFALVPALWLNQSGSERGDRPFIEYNGLLCRSEDALHAAHAFCAAMADEKVWRALYLSGLPFASPFKDIEGAKRQVLRDASPAYFVDLARVRGTDGGYLSLLSASTRGQIRRSLKGEPGPVAAETDVDAIVADHWLDAMQCLNAGRHRDNAWEVPFFRDFIRHLVAAGLGDGSVELLRVTSGEDSLGYLLNFVWGGRAINYQSAFAKGRSARSKPGLMCHAAAVERYARAGLQHYSLLAGKDRYKQSLSTGAEMLEWWTVERADCRLDIEAALRKLLGR